MTKVNKLIALIKPITKFVLEFDQNATVHRSLENIGLRELGDTLPGMQIALLPHQVIAGECI